MTGDPYPLELAGEPADPPIAAPPDLVEAWRTFEAGERELLEDAGPIFAAGSWRMAAALQQLLQEADAAAPGRDKRSDGGIGDARHAARVSDHNPDARGVVCARDFDVDGLDLPAAFERARRAVLAGKLPQLEGGYLIHAARITSPDFREWREYHGENPHVTHGHVSVAHDPMRADARGPWNVWTPPRSATPRASPTSARNDPPAPTRDLRGRGLSLTGGEGDQGPRVAALQGWLRRTFPAYAAGLDVDGVWGPQTSGVLREYARRIGAPIPAGRRVLIGPQFARRLTGSGFRS